VRSKLARHPFDTFQEAPVSTALTVAGLVPVATGVAGAVRAPAAILENIARPEPGLVPGLRAEAQAAKAEGYAGRKQPLKVNTTLKRLPIFSKR